MIQVLVEFGESRKVFRLLEEEHAFSEEIKKAFGIKGKMNIQMYNAEWEEFIDLDPGAYDKVEDRSKLRVIIPKVSFIMHVTYGI